MAMIQPASASAGTGAPGTDRASGALRRLVGEASASPILFGHDLKSYSG